MQPQFTDKAKAALILAERAARSLRQSYVGSEHILLGLLRENTGVAATVLLNNGVDVVRLKEMIKDLIVPETSVLIAERDGYSPRAQAILEEAHRQSDRFGSDKTGTEHILLALLKEGENVAVRLLSTMAFRCRNSMWMCLWQWVRTVRSTKKIWAESRIRKREIPQRLTITAGI